MEARDVAVHGDGLAGVVKGRLRDGVVAGVELELHKVADLRRDLLGREGLAAVAGDSDDVGGLGVLGCCLLVLGSLSNIHAGQLTRCQARESGEDEC